jgi:phosphoenolpyruvate synthase/pyruvate phosphate dikinase
VIHELKHERHHQDIDDTKLSVSDLKEMVARFKKLVKERTGKQFPNDPWAQLQGSIGAVFGSWMNDRAIVYRRKYNIPQEWGTAVNVQVMVFGNTGVNSGSGVAFTRDPATGEKVFYGEFLINAQGEDVVAGVRTPEPVADLKKHLPKALVELERIRHVLEAHFKDVQDFEFTIQDGKVFMLQTRNGKRTGVAAVKFACDMVREKLIEWKTAITRVPADQLDQVLAPVFDRAALKSARPTQTTTSTAASVPRSAVAVSRRARTCSRRSAPSPASFGSRSRQQFVWRRNLSPSGNMQPGDGCRPPSATRRPPHRMRPVTAPGGSRDAASIGRSGQDLVMRRGSQGS